MRAASPEATSCPLRPLGLQLFLHLLVGTLTLATAHMLFAPQARAGEHLTGANAAYASEEVGPAPAVSAPALSGAPTPSSTATQQASGRSDVMNDLRATMGRSTGQGSTNWLGIAGLDVNRRQAPNRSKPPVGDLKAGAPVQVARWVSGEEIEPHNDTWAELADGTFVYSASLRRAGAASAPPLPAAAPTTGRWIDVNLTEQIATAYDGRTAVRSVLVSSGRPGWATPHGTFPVLRRLERDTMDGATLIGQGPKGTGADYKVENVRYVQYFTADGAAIHENYWRRPATFGMPGSHGCIGMIPADAAWFWEFAKVGTPLVIHD